MSESKSIRCVRCREEFSEAEVGGMSACPSCGDPGVPMSISQDVTIKINWHELRILTIWATNWAQDKCEPSGQAACAAVIRHLEAQRPDKSFSPLTLFGEIQEIVDDGLIPGATVVDSRGAHEIKSKVGKA